MIHTEDLFKDTSWAYELNSSTLPFLSSCAHPYPSSMALRPIDLIREIILCKSQTLTQMEQLSWLCNVLLHTNKYYEQVEEYHETCANSNPHLPWEGGLNRGLLFYSTNYFWSKHALGKSLYKSGVVHSQKY